MAIAGSEKGHFVYYAFPSYVSENDCTIVIDYSQNSHH